MGLAYRYLLALAGRGGGFMLWKVLEVTFPFFRIRFSRLLSLSPFSVMTFFFFLLLLFCFISSPNIELARVKVLYGNSSSRIVVSGTLNLEATFSRNIKTIQF